MTADPRPFRFGGLRVGPFVLNNDLRHREPWGIGYVTLQADHLAALSPVIARLAGT